MQQAQQNPLLKPTLQSLFKAHDLVIYDVDVQNQDLAKGETTREDHQEDKEEDRIPNSPIQRLDLSPKPKQKPLEQPQYSDADRASSQRQRSKSRKCCRSPTHSPLSIQRGS